MASNKIYQKPVTRKVPTPKGKASNLNLAARRHAAAAYSPQPFPRPNG